MADSMVVTLLRHGVSRANLRKEYLGWTDSPLDARAYLSLDQLRGSLPRPDLLFASDLGRAVRTAEYVFSEQPEQLKGLRELNFGLWEGLSYEDLKGESDYQAWLDSNFQTAPPGGESFSDFRERVDKVWWEIKNRASAEAINSLTLVSHGGVIRHLLTSLTKGEKQFWDWQVKHGTAYQLSWSARSQFEEGLGCTSLQVVPSMAKVIG